MALFYAPGSLILFFFLPFLVFASLLLAGTAIVYLFVPETAGKNTESGNQ